MRTNFCDKKFECESFPDTFTIFEPTMKNIITRLCDYFFHELRAKKRKTTKVFD